ncbi:MAG: hypothetical protein ACPIEU_09040 [Candidatus Puniceispirillaceae bacterium]
MPGRKFTGFFNGPAGLFVIALAVGACQTPSANVTGPASHSPNDGNSTVPANDIAVADQIPETTLPQIEKVIEWSTSFSSFIMPPAEVRATIDKKCKEVGYDRGVITSMSLSDSKVVADFDCRGEDAT